MERDEWNDVHDTDARMDALVPTEIDQPDGACRSCDERVDQRIATACEREYRAVVIGVGVHVEQARWRREGITDLVDDGPIAAL
jgi:hypothetical protein